MTDSPLKYAKVKYCWALPAPIIALVLLAALCISLERPPQVVRADAPSTEFSAERAQRHLTAIAHAPHPIGSAHAQAVRDYLMSELRAAGLNPQVQQTTAVNADWGPPFPAGTVNNVLARLAGTANTKTLLLVTHYDSVNNSYGAADAGAGVAALLETLRALQAGARLRNDVIFLFTDGEEVGLLGAKAFVKDHPWAKDVGIALNFEARGSRGPALMFETSDGNGWLIDEFAKAAPRPIASSLFYEIYRMLPNGTDLTMFKRAGMQGLNFAFIEGAVNYHSLNDRSENLDGRSLQHQGSYAVALTRHFGNLSLNPGTTDNEVYFNFFGAHLIHYSARWSVPLMLIIVLLFVAVLVLGFKRRRLGVRWMIRGFLFLLTSVLAATASVGLVWWLLGKLHPQYAAQLVGDTYNSGFYFVAFAALTLALTAALYVWFGRRGNEESLLLGGLCWWLLLTVLTSLFLPGASYLFAWPFFFTLAGLGYRLSGSALEGGPQLKYVVAQFIAAVPCVMLLAPPIKMMFSALTVASSRIVVVFIVLLIGLLLPLLDASNVAHKWLLPVAAGVLALGGIVAGGLTAGVDQTRPRPNTLFYCLDGDAGHAVWASPDAAPDEWLRQFFSTGMERGALSECLPHSSRTFMKSRAAVIAEPPPQAELLDDRWHGNARTLRLRISSPRRANVVAVFLDRMVEVRSATVNDRPISPAAARGAQQQWGLIYYGSPHEGIILTLEVAATQASTLRVKVIDQSLALPVAPNLAYQSRPADSIPSTYVASDSTLVAKSFSF
jgi:peptidase M28-like protein